MSHVEAGYGAPAPVVIVHTQTTKEDDLAGPIVVFILGFFVWCVWLAGFAWIKSSNSTKRVLGILSVVFFFVYLVILVVVIAVVVSTAAAAAKAAREGNYYYTTGY
eukprot:TRINITY_DN1493_c0_g1_i1.p1 TRINITY_DN1493_c0_g1~~TRINITY_DN1493_c0_g1_i1.p1  ORF type:complete len:106 (-),score=21.99 TRINITY_DN1493_c0_g1_i1:116-433(-)